MTLQRTRSKPRLPHTRSPSCYSGSTCGTGVGRRSRVRPKNSVTKRRIRRRMGASGGRMMNSSYLNPASESTGPRAGTRSSSGSGRRRQTATGNRPHMTCNHMQSNLETPRSIIRAGSRVSCTVNFALTATHRPLWLYFLR